MSDWILGTVNTTLNCGGSPGTPPPTLGDDDYPLGANYCTITVPLPTDQCNGRFYVNAHLDYGLKGKDVDGADALTAPDRYDAMNGPTPWNTYDAFVNVGPGVTPSVVAINDCTPYTFSHGAFPNEMDTVYSLNTFKKIAGVFSLTTTGADGGRTGVPGVTATLKNKATNQVVVSGIGDEDGSILLAYKHTGKAATYTVTLNIPGVGTRSKDVQLKANGWAEASYDVFTNTWFVQSIGK
jgi:hypothetical protein